MSKTANAPEAPLELLARDLRPDAKQRVSLGRALADLGAEVRFDLYRNERGQIILDPQVSIPAAEAWIYRDPEALATLRRGLEQAGAGRAKRAGSFAKFGKKD